MKPFSIGDVVRLTRDAHLFSGWRGVAEIMEVAKSGGVMLRMISGESAGGIADVMDYQIRRWTPPRACVPGAFFHSYHDNGDLDLQGLILIVQNDVVTVQLFEWINGEESERRLFNRHETASWRFYRTRKEWLEAYAAYDKSRHSRKSAAGGESP